MTSDEKIIAALNLDLVQFNKLIEQGTNFSKILKMNLRELSQIKVGKDGLIGWNDAQEKNNEKLKTGAQLMKDYYREQRIQDRTMREASQAAIGFTLGIAALASANGEASATTKKVTNTILTGITAMQGAEFTAYAIGTATRSYTGAIGQASAYLTKHAGIIGAVVGVGTALIALFQNINAEAKKAAEEGLNDFEKRLRGLSPIERTISISVIGAEKEQAKKDIEELQKQGKAAAKKYGIESSEAKDLLRRVGLRQEELDYLEELYDNAKNINKEENVKAKLIERNNKILLASSEGVNKLKAQVEIYNAEIAKGNEYNKEGKRYVDLKSEAEKQIAKHQQTSNETAKDTISLLQSHYTSGKLTTAEYIKQLTAQRNLLTDTKEQEKIDSEILKIKKQQAEQQIAIQLAVKTAQVQFEKEMQNIRLQGEEQYLQSVAKTESEKLQIQKTIALERIHIEEEAQNKILDAQIEAVRKRLKQKGLGDLEKNQLQADLQGLIVSKGKNASTANANRNNVNQSYNQGVDALSKSLDASLGENDNTAIARMMSAKQLTESISSEEWKLVDIEKEILTTKDIMRKEELASERASSLEKIGIWKQELSAREAMTASLIQNGFAMYDANKSLSENMAGIARDMIKQALSIAVADSLKSVFATIPFPFNLVAAPTAGAAVAALFEKLIPKFGDGTKATKATLGIFGEAGPELLMPEKKFYQIAREEIVPSILSMAKRELVNSYAARSGGSTAQSAGIDIAPLLAELKQNRQEMRNVVSAIKQMPPSEVYLNNAIVFEKELKKTLPEAQRYVKKKYPDGV